MKEKTTMLRVPVRTRNALVKAKAYPEEPHYKVIDRLLELSPHSKEVGE